MTYAIANTKLGVTVDRLSTAGKLSAQEHRWIGRCKKCRRTHKLEGHVMQAYNESGKWNGSFVVQANDGQVYLAADLGSNPYEVVVPCEEHWCRLKMVHEGTKASKHECGSKCTNATGPNCDCRCKGKNHGSNC